MGWRLEARSSSDVGQWSTALRQLAGDFAISATSVECYGLSHVCFCLQLSSNVITRVWIDNLYHIKPAKWRRHFKCIAAYALVRRRRRRRRNAQPQRVGRVWIKPHIGRHDEQGAYENLVEELRHDPAEFEKVHRVNPATFDFLLAKVDGVISRQNTTL